MTVFQMLFAARFIVVNQLLFMPFRVQDVHVQLHAP